MVLAAELGLDLPLVSLSARHAKVVISSGVTGRKNAIDGGLLGRRGDVVLHFLNHAGVLLYADLSGLRGDVHWHRKITKRLQESSHRSCRRHGHFLSGRPDSAGPIRLVFRLLSPGSRLAAESPGTTDRSQFLLRVFIRLFLYRSVSTAAERPQ